MTSRRRPGLAPYPVPRELEGTQACAGADTDEFFPGSGANGEPLEEVKNICRGCLFYDACLAYALDRPDLFGIWGGTSKLERAEMRRHARRNTA